LPSSQRAPSEPGHAERVRFRLGLLAATAVFTVWLTYRALVLSPTGQRFDQSAMVESMQAAPSSADHLRDLMQAVSVPSIGVAVGVLAAIAVARSRPRLGVAAAATVLGSNVTTQALKHWLVRPDLLDLGPANLNSFPSGHVTVVASLAAGALLVMPRRAQPTVAAVGIAATAVTALATVALGWHRPSDVIGAIGVVGAWAAIAGAWAAGRSSTPTTPSLPAPPSRSRVVVQSIA
jgi:membrane-associated phospholipid phosphatase